MKGGDMMKKTIALIVSFLFVFSVAGLAFAQEKEGAAPAPAKEEKKMPEKKHKKKVRHYVHGEVTAVDAAANTLTVKGKKGEMTLTVDDKTRFPKGMTLADVKAGEKLTVRYMEADGKMMATSITMKKAHHHEKKEMKQEEKKEETK
jgi:phage baseplate assembly protein gpV